MRKHYNTIAVCTQCTWLSFRGFRLCNNRVNKFGQLNRLYALPFHIHLHAHLFLQNKSNFWIWWVPISKSKEWNVAVAYFILVRRKERQFLYSKEAIIIALNIVMKQWISLCECSHNSFSTINTIKGMPIAFYLCLKLMSKENNRSW